MTQHNTPSMPPPQSPFSQSHSATNTTAIGEEMPSNQSSCTQTSIITNIIEDTLIWARDAIRRQDELAIAHSMNS